MERMQGRPKYQIDMKKCEACDTYHAVWTLTDNMCAICKENTCPTAKGTKTELETETNTEQTTTESSQKENEKGN